MPPEAIRRLESELERLAGAPVTLDRPSRPEHGDYATNVALQQAPRDGRPPRDLAESLAREAAGLPEVERAEVAGPGFVNLFLASGWYGDALAEMLAAGEAYGGGSAAVQERVQVELVSANPTGPLTVGSARNAAYGDSVARLLEFAGHEVEREYYVNDVGRQTDLFRESVEARRRGEEPPVEGYTGDYVREIAAEEGDPVERMLKVIEEELVEFRVPLDTWVLQGEVEREIPEAVAQVDTYEAEGTTWARTSAHGDDKDRPLVRSSDGSYLYFAGDVAYVRNKFGRGFDRLIYVLGADHHGYVGRLKAAASMLGYDPDRLEVLIYQLVHIVEGGAARQSS
ncbi:MAG TPA: arginine--tRNA ligase, partial [Solirubrobacterales bacterium]